MTPSLPPHALAAPSALDTLLRHADHPSALLALNRGTDHFRLPGVDGLVAYAVRGGWAYQLGGVFAPERDRRALLAAFRAHVRGRGLRLCALQLRAGDVPLYRAAGFRLNQLGTSCSLDVARTTLRGAAFMQLRNKVSRARRAGVEVVEAGVEVERDAALWGALRDVSASWLQSKGASPGRGELRFLVGELGEPGDVQRRVLVARLAGEVVGFVTLLRAPGSLPGWLHDLSRRTAAAPPGTMELITSFALDRLRREGAAYLHFGLTPLVGLAHDDALGGSRAVSWLMGLLHRHGQALYPAESQARYKLKWGPQVVAPEYFAYEGRYRLGCLLRLLQLAGAV